jgi:hypothetical protein
MMLPPEPDRWTIDLANAQWMEAIAAFAPQTTPKSRRSWRSPTTSRYSHVTVCC